MKSSLLSFFAFSVFLTGCSHLLYYPSPVRYVDEEKLKYPPKEVFIKYDKDLELLAWLFEAPKHRNITLVFFHGNGQNISAHYRSLYWLLDHGYNFLIVEYPGYGPNSGYPTPTSTVKTGKLAIEWLQKNRPEHKIGIFGQSLGGNVALRTISEMPNFKPCIVTIESSFLSYKEAARQVMKKQWFTWPFQYLSYIVLSDSKAITSNLEALSKAPYLIMHGQKDQIVPFELGKELYNKLPIEDKKFWPIPAGKHIDTFAKHFEFRPRFLAELKNTCGKN